MPNTNKDDQRIIAQTKKWLESVIVAHNYCPFAKREIDKGSVRYQLIYETEFNSLLESVIQECIWLDQNAETETTLIILPANLSDFNSFLDCLVLAEDLLISQGYEGTYQIASFHPDYCFQGAEENDPANFTNRSPYPMFHLIRESSVQLAIENHPDAESIPERNVEYARQQGLEKMTELFNQCFEPDDSDD
ncbi:MAG: DUF1415 domain-containing protein [Gammaproteobacteria bacterium]|nr:MAG: DUF1415 domain-containing protein [Gammaproteobacteria bacterium]